MTQSLTQTLQTVLVDSYALSLKLQNYHWNVEGPHFKPLHELFEEQYTELSAVIDTIAERIRALGEKVPAGLALFSKATGITDGDAHSDDVSMVKDLHDSHMALSATLRKALGVAQAAGDDYTLGLITERIGVHEKAAWMLRASLPEAVRKAMPKAAA